MGKVTKAIRIGGRTGEGTRMPEGPEAYNSAEEIEWLKSYFEFELCSECGKDWDRHLAVPLDLGAYGRCLFAYCLDGEED